MTKKRPTKKLCAWCMNTIHKTKYFLRSYTGRPVCSEKCLEFLNQLDDYARSVKTDKKLAQRAMAAIAAGEPIEIGHVPWYVRLWRSIFKAPRLKGIQT